MKEAALSTAPTLWMLLQYIKCEKYSKPWARSAPAEKRKSLRTTVTWWNIRNGDDLHQTKENHEKEPICGTFFVLHSATHCEWLKLSASSRSTRKFHHSMLESGSSRTGQKLSYQVITKLIYLFYLLNIWPHNCPGTAMRKGEVLGRL